MISTELVRHLSQPAVTFPGGRNKIINGGFNINQRGYISGAVTTVGQFVFDRWKVTATSGVTFSTTENKTTVTIPGGQTMQQVIEGANLQTGACVLTWEGTAQARIDGGAYFSGGSATALLTGGTNTTIEFNAGTVANVQLESGSIATPFEPRLIGVELGLCKRYFQTVLFLVNGYVTGTADIYSGVNYPVPMRASPSVVKTSGSFSNATDPGSPVVTASHLTAYVRGSGAGYAYGSWIGLLDAEL